MIAQIGPRLDQAIGILGVICLVAGIALLAVYRVVERIRQLEDE